MLPFVNIGGDKTGQAFADGLMEVLTTRLSGVERENRGLLVVAATEIRREGITSAQDARRAFRATHAVTGSLQRLNSRIRLTLNLTDAATLATVRGEVIEDEAIDAGALQDAAVAALARMLDVHVDDAAARANAVPGVYEYYLQGRGYLQRFERVDNVDSAIDLFTRVTRQDPEFALGHAALGEAFWRKYELTRDPALVEKARAEVQLAVDRDRASATVRVTSGIVARGTGAYEKAVAELLGALALDRSNADAHRELGRAYEALERWKDAEDTYRKAIDMRPGDWLAHGALGRLLWLRGRYPEALQQFQVVTQLTPDNARAYSNIGGIHVLMNEYDHAAKAFEKSVSIRPTPEALSNLGTLHFTRGRFADAAEAFQKSVDLAGSNYQTWGHLGSAYQWVPDRARAAAAYEKAIALAIGELGVDPRRGGVLADLADYSQALGRQSDALRYASRALETSPNDAVVMFKVAVAYEGLNKRAQALGLLHRAVRAGYPIDQIEKARSLSSLRTDPGYQRILTP